MPISWCSLCRPATSRHNNSPQAGEIAEATPPLWLEYFRWNAAFADLVYSVDHAYQPVYLDVEDDLLVSVAAILDISLTAEQAIEMLCSVVRQTLVLGTTDEGGSVFSRHRKRLDVWWSRTMREGARADDPPPVIALLAVFARAAELMERDARFRASAYFPRLQQLLGISAADAGRLQASFRHESEYFWGSLNEWLTGMNGALGQPTAEALGHRYVGIPLSQALIRTADRQRFSLFFLDAGLEPGMNMGASDMATLLGRWIQAGNASASIKKLWGSSGGRAIVAETAALTLSQWNGVIKADTQGGRLVQPPVLTARITKLLTGKRLRLGFAVRGHAGGSDGLPDQWVINSAPGAPEVRLDAINDRLLVPDIAAEVDALTLLTGELKVRPAGGGHSLVVSPRRPQPLVVLNYVEEAGLYVEVDRVRMLEPHLLLVNTNAKRLSGPKAVDFDNLLTEVAEPGYAKDETLKGLPQGWVLYRGVTVARPHANPDPLLEPLKPAQTSTLIVGGGLRLPGHADRRHTDAPLRLTGSAIGATSLTLSLSRTDAEESLPPWSGDADEISASTSGLQLEPGTYRAELEFILNGKVESSIRSFSLCDSDEPRIRPLGRAITYDLTTPLGALLAAPTPGADENPVKFPLHGTEPVSCPRAELEPPWWSLTPIEYAAETLAAPSPPDSCVMTGSHVWKIETHIKGMKRDRGECTKCGRVGWFPPRGRPKQPKDPAKYAQASLRRLDFGDPATDITGVTLLDALTWLGGGTPAELAKVVRQVYDSALTVDEMVRALETLGHVSVARDPRTFAIGGWEMSPRCLAGLEDGTWLATGGWNRSDVAALADVARECGGTLRIDQDDWLPRRVLHNVSDQGAQYVAEVMDADIQPQAGRRLLAALPSLTAGMDALHDDSAEGIYDAEWFDSSQARWVEVQSIGQPGAYRIRRGFISSYVLRTAEDIGRRRLRRADSRVVKHLANVHRPIAGYEAGSDRLFVPLGADLPGLYGRAMSLLAGRPPARVQGTALLAYSSVREDAACALVSLLKGDT